jgi:hypothetical protein
MYIIEKTFAMDLDVNSKMPYILNECIQIKST